MVFWALSADHICENDRNCLARVSRLSISRFFQRSPFRCVDILELFNARTDDRRRFQLWDSLRKEGSLISPSDLSRGGSIAPQSCPSVSISFQAGTTIRCHGGSFTILRRFLILWMSFKHETKDQPAGNETTKQKNIFLRERLSPRHRFLEHSSLESIILFPFYPTFRNEINLQICKSYPLPLHYADRIFSNREIFNHEWLIKIAIH